MLLATESFEVYDLNVAANYPAQKFTSSSSTPPYTTTTGFFAGPPTGARQLSSGGTGNSLGVSYHLPVADRHETLIFGFATTNGATGNPWINFLSPISVGSPGFYSQMFLSGGVDGFTLRRSDTSAVVATYPSNPVSAWRYVEVKFTLDDTNGYVEVRIDGVPVVTFTGKTRYQGTVSKGDPLYNVNLITMNQDTNSAVDDFYLCNGAGSVNNDFLVTPAYSVHVETLLPNANGTHSDFVGSDGNSTNNYALVDDLGTVLTDYVESSGVGDKDTYNFPSSSFGTADGVAGVIVWAYVEKTDTANVHVDFVALLGGVEATARGVESSNYLGTDALRNQSYGWFRGIFETKPGGGLWTVADLNASEFGVKVS